MSAALGWIKGFARFWYHFLVGDDWTIAAGVAVTFAATYLLVQAGVDAWWVIPVAAVVVLVLSVVRANKRA